MTTSPHADPSPGGPLWQVGQVASLLGVPAVTLRSWERRYGVGPSRRSAGRHRRYDRSDVERLQRMRNLIAAGTPAREAAASSAATVGGSDHDSRGLWTGFEARQLVEFASTSRLRSLADGVESCLAQRGLASAWNDVIRPALRILEARYLTAGDCIDIEMVLIQAVSEAVDRHIHVVRPRVGDVPGPVLLVCSPGERHSLPLKVLHGVLLDLAVPAVLLGPGLPSDAVSAAIARIAPSVVVLWALIRRRELMRFHGAITATGVTTCAAGPGWPQASDPVTTPEFAVARISNLWLDAATEPHTGRI